MMKCTTTKNQFLKSGILERALKLLTDFFRLEFSITFFRRLISGERTQMHEERRIIVEWAMSPAS